MAQQPGQPVGGPIRKPKFNWTRLIMALLFLAAVTVLILWLAGVFSPDKIKTYSFEEVYQKYKGKNLYYKDDIYNHLVYFRDTAKGDWNGKIEINPSFFTSSLLSEVPNKIKELFFKEGVPLAVSSAKAPTESVFTRILYSLVPTLFILMLMLWLFRRSGGAGGMGEVFSVGKNQARKINSKIKFSNVAGQEEVKEEVKEVVDFLKKPAKYKAAGARVPKGILLSGPPGTGKTLLAKAVAGEASVPFYFISASNFVEMFAGLGAKRVREMFKASRQAAPAILFIDELDAIGRKRGSSLSGNDEREQTLNQILVEMDGMDENSGLLVISATNRPDVLDPALLRPGRFDRKITVSLPDIKERQQILELHAKGKRIAKEVHFKNIAKRTPRFSGAQLENIINEAALLSVREETGVITLMQIDEAIDRVNAGPAKKHRVITPEENKLVAIHEAGHAVTGLKVPDADIVQKVTIIPRGEAGGYTLRTPKKDQYNYRKSQLEANIIGALGGRAAEQVYYGIGEVSTGASDDIKQATTIARRMVTQWGMSKLGPIAYERNQGSQYLGQETIKEYSDALAERIDEAIRDIVVTAEEKAIEIVKKHTKLIDLIVEELLEKETIVLEEINYINKHLKRPPKDMLKSKKQATKKSLSNIIDEVENSKKQSNFQILKWEREKM